MPTALTAGPCSSSVPACGPELHVSLFERVSAATLRGVMVLETWSERVHQRRALRELSGHLLQDLALSKADIEAEAQKPFWKA
jgi:uncharacterized protein YjiS (DUF1127 family)